MPDGLVQRIDPSSGRAVIVRRGREYNADVSDIDSSARVPGARVHFDISRDGGIDRARNVRLSSGTRTNRRQRRFGDLTGARRPGAKVKTTAARNLGVDVATQAVDVLTAWVEAMTDADRDAALSLYSPDAVVHDGDETIRGRRHVAAFLERTMSTSTDPAAVAIAGEDQLVRVDWPGEIGATPARSDWFAVVRGHIIEQWCGDGPDVEGDEHDAGPTIDVVTSGPISAREIEVARDRLLKTADGIDRPVRSLRMKLAFIEHPSELPASGSASIDIDGTVLRSSTGARTIADTIDQLIKRLDHQLDRFTDRHRDKSTSDAWRHASLPSARPSYYDRPVSERSLVRHKSYTTDRTTLDEALWDMHSLDYDFFLFTEASTGRDCLLRYADDALVLDGVGGPEGLPVHDAVAAASTKPPTSTVSEAIARLNEGGESHVFFENEATGRGNVVYRRYDGHHGLITPADAEE